MGGRDIAMKILKTAAVLLFAVLAASAVRAEEAGKIISDTDFLPFAQKSQEDLDAEKIYLDQILLGFAQAEYGIKKRVCRRELDRLVATLQLGLEKEAREKKAKGEPALTFEERVRFTYKYIFDTENFNYKDNFGDLSFLSINRIIDNREGNSLGLGLLVLAVVERLSGEVRMASLAGAWTGDHFVLAYRNMTTQQMRYLEPDERGADRSSRSYDVPDAAVKKKSYLTPLYKEELVGLICYARAKMYYTEKKFGVAEAYLKLSIERAPNLIEPRMLIARIMLGKMEGDAFRKARGHLDAVCKLNPVYAKGFFLRGIAHYHTGEADAAVKDFKTVQKLNPVDKQSYYYIGLIAYDEGDMPTARKMFNAFLSRSGKDLASMRKKAKSFVNEINASEPIRIFQDTSSPYKDRITALKKLGRLKVASSVAPLIEALSDENIRFRYLCARVLSDITGKDFGVDQAGWQLWWNSMKPGEYR